MKNLKIGQFFTLTKKFTENDVKMFITLSGDNNPLHYDKEFCKTTIFKKPICHGMLGASLFSNILGNEIIGSIYISQTLKFLKPIYIDEQVEAIIRIDEFKQEKKQLKLLTQVIKENKEIAIDGEAVIKFPTNKYNILL
jgi:3-hydroxybutyryl-CoA dehydratase